MTGSVVSPAMRQRVRGLATPVARFLGRLGLTPNALTVIGFFGTCLAAAAAASQAWLIAGVLVLLFGIFDLFDGTLARATGKVTKFGAFLDSTLDRAGEAVVYVGIAVGCIAGGFDMGAVIATAAMAGAFMVSYTRAKSESLGFNPGTGMANVGLAPREVRIAILALGLSAPAAVGLVAPAALGGVASTTVHGLCSGAIGAQICQPDTVLWSNGALVLGGALGLIAVLAIITTVQRIAHVRAQSREG